MRVKIRFSDCFFNSVSVWYIWVYDIGVCLIYIEFVENIIEYG